MILTFSQSISTSLRGIFSVLIRYATPSPDVSGYSGKSGRKITFPTLMARSLLSLEMTVSSNRESFPMY
jgi:hypothetical protein